MGYVFKHCLMLSLVFLVWELIDVTNFGGWFVLSPLIVFALLYLFLVALIILVIAIIVCVGIYVEFKKDDK